MEIQRFTDILTKKNFAIVFQILNYVLCQSPVSQYFLQGFAIVLENKSKHLTQSNI
jgi:hypothetical protein